MSQPWSQTSPRSTLGVGFFQARLAVAEALDLGARQDDAGLDLLDQVELEARADGSARRRGCRRRPSPCPWLSPLPSSPSPPFRPTWPPSVAIPDDRPSGSTEVDPSRIWRTRPRCDARRHDFGNHAGDPRGRRSRGELLGPVDRVVGGRGEDRDLTPEFGRRLPEASSDLVVRIAHGRREEGWLEDPSSRLGEFPHPCLRLRSRARNVPHVAEPEVGHPLDAVEPEVGDDPTIAPIAGRPGRSASHSAAFCRRIDEKSGVGSRKRSV